MTRVSENSMFDLLIRECLAVLILGWVTGTVLQYIPNTGSATGLKGKGQADGRLAP